MAEIANLNRARKTKVRSDAAAQAARNRIAFGLTKAQRAAMRAERAAAAAALDGHKRDT
jgi:hypothetical protein